MLRLHTNQPQQTCPVLAGLGHLQVQLNLALESESVAVPDRTHRTYKQYHAVVCIAHHSTRKSLGPQSNFLQVQDESTRGQIMSPEFPQDSMRKLRAEE